jgi:hypothetical protein
VREAVRGRERAGELAQRRPVDVAGDDWDDGRVARRGLGFGAGQPARPATRSGAPARPGACGGTGPGALPQPRVFGAGRARQVPQLGQAQVHLDLGGLAAAGGQRAGRDEAAAGVLQRVVAALRGGPGVFRAGLLT